MHFDHLRFIWGAEICCWQFNAHSTPLTDSSEVPAIGPRASLGAKCAVVQNPDSGEPSSGERQGWGHQRGKHNLGHCVQTLPAVNGDNDKLWRKCGCRAALGGPSARVEGDAEHSAEGHFPKALHIRVLKQGPQCQRNFITFLWSLFRSQITTAGSWLCNAALQMDRLKVNSKDRFH